MLLESEQLNNRWLALQVRGGWETRTAYGLKDRGYEEFVPLFEEKRRWSDRVKVFQVPLFTGYVFVRFDAHNSNPILKVPGVLRFVGLESSPIPIEDSEIESLQATTRTALNYGPCAFLKTGQEVEIKSGPLAGLVGIITRFKNKQRLIINVNLLMKSMFVEIDGYEVAARNSQTSEAAVLVN